MLLIFSQLWRLTLVSIGPHTYYPGFSADIYVTIMKHPNSTEHKPTFKAEEEPAPFFTITIYF